MNTCIVTVRKLIFDRFSFGHSDRSPVVKMNPGAEKGTKVGSRLLRCMLRYSVGISCMCELMCV